MPTPRALAAAAAVAVPAATASLAYLSARTQIGHDLSQLASGVAMTVAAARYEARDRISFFYRLEERAADPLTREKPFIISFDGGSSSSPSSRTFTFGQTYTLVLKYATYLKTRFGVQPRDVVAVDMVNAPELLFLLLALWELGAIPALINYNLTGDGLLHCVRTSTAKVLLVDPDTAQRALNDNLLAQLAANDFRGPGKGSPDVVVLDDKVLGDVEQTQGQREPDEVRGGLGLGPDKTRIAALVFTSGTTGLPKPAIGSFLKFYAAPGYAKFWAGIKPDDIFYTCMPLYHASALVMAAMPCLSIGYTLALGRKFSSATFWPEVRASKATVIQYVGETCRYLLAAPPQIDGATGENLDRKHSVRMAFGNGLRPDIWKRFQDRFGIEEVAEFYGGSEAPAALWNFSRNSFSVGAMGRMGLLMGLLWSNRIKVVALDPQTDEPLRHIKKKKKKKKGKGGKEEDDNERGFYVLARPGEPGELFIALEGGDEGRTYQGYFGNSKATEGKLVRGAFAEGDAWFRTGDLIRRDDQGRFFFVDRIGDSFRWRAENVSTQEVGDVVGAHPAVADANVYGVLLPHHDGRAGCAAITFIDSKSSGSGSGGDGTGVSALAQDYPATGLAEVGPEILRSVAKHAAENLPKYAVPQFLRVVPNVYATGNYKQQKNTLRQDGVDPAKLAPGESLFWLRDGTYVPFGRPDWDRLNAGQVKL